MARGSGFKRYTGETLAMPAVLGAEHVAQIGVWPVLGRARRYDGATDVLVHLVDAIRTGNRHNCRRVRYDGRLYVLWRGVRVYLVGALAWEAWELCGHVYGIDLAADAAHNKTLRGY